MKTSTLLPCCALAAALGGCVTMAKNEARTELADTCAAMGDDVRIAAGEPESRGGTFGTVVLTGYCLSPGEDGYDDAVPVDEYRASIRDG